MRYLIVACTFLFLASACSVTYVCEDGTIVKNPDECKVEIPEPEPEEEKVMEKVPEPVEEQEIDEEPETDIGPDVQELIDESKKVKSFSYMHYRPENKGLGETFYYKEGIMKRELSKITEYFGRVFNTVYFNTETKVAEAYCEAEQAKCTDRNQVFDVRYDDFYVESPLDWLDEIVYARSIGTERIENKIVTVIEFKSANESGRMWIRGAGIPMKVETEEGVFEFDQLVINAVADEEVTHQELSNDQRYWN